MTKVDKKTFILDGKHHCERCGTAIDPDTFMSCEMIQWTEDTRFCEGDHCYLQTEDGKREIQDGYVTEEALENADDYDRRLREKALQEINNKLKKKKAELWDFLLETKFSTRLSIQKEKGLEQSIKELEERKKQLEGGVT